MNHQKFEKAGDIERQKMTQLFNKFGVTQFQFTESKSYDRIEGYYTGTTGNEYVFEVKCRKVGSTDFNETIIDKNKVDAVIDESKKSNHKPILFFFFNDEKCMYQKIKEDDYFLVLKHNAPLTTMGLNKMVEKEMVHFFIHPNQIIELK